jgi:hypothetical protein
VVEPLLSELMIDHVEACHLKQRGRFARFMLRAVFAIRTILLMVEIIFLMVCESIRELPKSLIRQFRL